tara:strand:- start:640 stop:927 length:288 start_codon:yes stop_codon:yes gene_type:complete
MKFKLQEDGSYTDLDMLAAGTPNCYPAGHATVEKWIAAGNVPEPYVPPVPTYTELRQQVYPPIGDQLDALWKGGQPEADMKLIIDGVKATHPKVI